MSTLQGTWPVQLGSGRAPCGGAVVCLKHTCKHVCKTSSPRLAGCGACMDWLGRCRDARHRREASRSAANAGQAEAHLAVAQGLLRQQNGRQLCGPVRPSWLGRRTAQPHGRGVHSRRRRRGRRQGVRASLAANPLHPAHAELQLPCMLAPVSSVACTVHPWHASWPSAAPLPSMGALT